MDHQNEHDHPELDNILPEHNTHTDPVSDEIEAVEVLHATTTALDDTQSPSSAEEVTPSAPTNMAPISEETVTAAPVVPPILPVQTPAAIHYPAFQPQKRQKRKPMSTKVKVFLILFVTVIGIMGISAIGQLFTLYEVSLQSEDGNFSIHLEPRYFPEAPRRQPPTSPPPSLFPQQDDPFVNLPAPNIVVGDGTTIELLPRPEVGEDGTDPHLSFQEIYQLVSPSVVLIEVSIRSAFGIGIGSGTGIVISEHGFILTSAHVIEDARNITVTLYNGLRFEANLVGMDAQTDLAVLKIDATGLTPAMFGDSDLTQVGEEVAVIGNPLGQFHTMSNGIISAVNRDIVYDGVTMRMLQTNAAINEGNSGGPLINLYGQVIGVANLKLISADGSVEGMGFAIPSAIIKPVVDALLAFGEMPARPSIGIIVLTIEATEAMQMDILPGVYVESVAPNADAYRQGLQAGDHIMAAAGIPIENIFDLRTVIGRFAVGDTLTLSIGRDGEVFDMDVILMDSDLVQH